MWWNVGVWLGLDAISSNSSRILTIKPFGNDNLTFLANKGGFYFSSLAINLFGFEILCSNNQPIKKNMHRNWFVKTTQQK